MLKQPIWLEFHPQLWTVSLHHQCRVVAVCTTYRILCCYRGSSTAPPAISTKNDDMGNMFTGIPWSAHSSPCCTTSWIGDKWPFLHHCWIQANSTSSNFTKRIAGPMQWAINSGYARDDHVSKHEYTFKKTAWLMNGKSPNHLHSGWKYCSQIKPRMKWDWKLTEWLWTTVAFLNWLRNRRSLHLSPCVWNLYTWWGSGMKLAIYTGPYKLPKGDKDSKLMKYYWSRDKSRKSVTFELII